MISIHTADLNGTFLYASRGFCRHLGVEPSRLLGVSLIAVVHPEDQQAVSQHLRQCLILREVSNIPYKLCIRGQTTFVVESSMRLGQQGLVCITKLRGLVYC
mmetsp:Transcript_20021/g.28940  ORF Transcript_20021/g.28940 Transcript_20021/m.28940 type:complete len:102 (+) Transcript_20021:241-546(+)